MSRVYYEAYERHEQEGLAAYKEGEFKKARQSLLKAAEYLLLAAKDSEERQARSRLQKSRKLRELAQKIPENGSKSATGKLPRVDAAEAEQTDDDPAFTVMERPSIDFSDVAGCEAVKEEIRLKMIYPSQHPEKAAAYKVRRGGGILLYGPPGTGKTLIARATAGELDAAFFTVRPSQIMSKWVGEAEKNIAKLFETARNEPKSVIFIDEVEALVPERGGDNRSGVMQRLVPQILTELEGIDTSSANPTLFMGATNTPWQLDPAVLRPGRFDALIYLGLPEPITRQRIIELQLDGRPVEEQLDLSWIIEATEGFSGADLRNLVEKAAASCFRQAIADGEIHPIRRETFEHVLKTQKPSVMPELLTRFEQFRATRSHA